MLQLFDKRNENLIVCVNGEFSHRNSAGVSPFDSAVQNGDAVWEGLRIYEGKVFRLQAHLDRLRKSASMLQYSGYPKDVTIIEYLRETLERNNMYDGVHVRLTISRGLKYTSGLDPRINQSGCSIIVLAEHKPPVFDTEGITLATAMHRRPPTQVLDQHIHSCNQLTSILAKLEANAAGTDDALLLDLNGNLAETSSTHVFAVFDGAIHTSTTSACPEGITRSTIKQLCQSRHISWKERDISHAELFEADELFVSGTMGELVPVIRLDDHRYRIRSMYEAMSRYFRDEVSRGTDLKLVSQ